MLSGKNIGFAITGAFYGIENVINEMSKLVMSEAEIIPIMSYYSYNIKSNIINSEDMINKIENITGKHIIKSIEEAETIGHKYILDVMTIIPCTGNTIAKFANGIADTAVLVAAKAHLKREKPLVIGIATSDGLSNNAENIGKIMNKKNVYLVPFRQDNPLTKPYSLRFDINYTSKTIISALDNKQIQPILL